MTDRCFSFPTVPTGTHHLMTASFAVVPVPVLLTVAALTLFVGTDHPVGKWEDRFECPLAPRESVDRQGFGVESSSPNDASSNQQPEKERTSKDMKAATDVTFRPVDSPTSEVDVAVNRPMTMAGFRDLATNPLTWLPSLAYLTTFGFELAMDANLASLLFDIYHDMDFGQTKAGYIAAIYGLLNVFSRAFGESQF